MSGACRRLLFGGALLALLLASQVTPPKHPTIATAVEELPFRFTAGRLSSNVSYKPPAARTRPPVEMIAALRAARSARDSAIADLVLGDSESAVAKLEEELRAVTGARRILDAIIRSRNPELLNDLAVAYIERAPRIDDPRDYLLAIECADRAFRLSNTNVFAWNRALALERAGFRELAAEAWRRSAAGNETSGWANEARDHLRRLHVSSSALPSREELAEAIRDAASRGDTARLRAMAEQTPERFRIASEEVLLPHAASSLPQRGEPWNAARLASAVLATRGETMLRDSLDALERSKERDVAAAARAMTDYRRGRDVMRTNYQQSFALLTSAADALNALKNPFALRAEVYRCTVRYYDQPNGEHAIELIDDVLHDHPEVERWPLAAAQMHWIRALVLQGRGDPGGALQAYTEAARAIAQTTESSSRAGIEQALADALRDVGDGREGWRHQLASVAAVDRATPYDRKLNVLNGVVQESSEEGYQSLPRLVHEGALELARAERDPLYLCSTLLVGIKVATNHGETAHAFQLLAEAEKEWERLSNSAMAKRLRADIEAARFRLLAAAGQQPDVDSLTRALALLHDIANRTRIAELLLLRARAFERAGERDRARQDLRGGLAELDSQRRGLSDEEKRSQAAVAIRLLDEWTALELDAGDVELAFDIAERGRARLLLERTARQATWSRPRTWAEVRPRLGQDRVIVAYSVLPDSLVVWRGTHAGLTVRRTPLDAAALRDRFEQFARFVTGAKDTDPSLYPLLCGDLLEGDGARTIVFVPDTEMFDLPFAALRDPRDGAYLVERVTFVIAPSVTLAVLLARSDTSQRPRAPLIVAVSNAPGFPVLPSVRKEVAQMAARLPNAKILLDERVTVDAFRQHAASSTSIHFAGHAVANARRPERSALIFGSSVGRGSLLTAKEIASMQFDALELVVLAACQTADGTSVAEAPMTLAMAFVAAGAPAVIASTLDVDDEASARLFREFYDHDSPAVEALRRAQLKMLRDPRFRAPRHWAPFTVIAGAN